MKLEKNRVFLEEEDLKKVFALFTSCTQDEKRQVLDESSARYFKKENLSEEYELRMTKRDFAIDAWRSVLAFLQSQGVKIKLNDSEISLSFVESEFM